MLSTSVVEILSLLTVLFVDTLVYIDEFGSASAK